MKMQKLLIVDDSPDIHELVRLGLAAEPLEFFFCETGEECLAQAPEICPDLLLLDVELPGLDGFDVCRRLKANAATAEIPVVFLTGASSTEEKLRGLELGAIDYVTKPFDPAELRARVRAALNTRRLMRLLADKALTLQESEERFRILAGREQIRADVLEMIAQGRTLNEILRRLIDAVESQEPDAMAAGVMLNSGLLHSCAPHLPPSIGACIEKHLYSMISRFTAHATASDDRMIICDLLTDPAWQEFQPAILEHGLRSCWSILICSRCRETSGIFSLYRRDNRRPEGPAIEILKLASDLTAVAVETRQLSDQLSFQARHDSLTQLPNRALFADRLEQAIATSSRTGKSVAVLLVDVDRFKHVNDTYGHQAGDEMLCQVAHRLRSRLRASDVLARMGGDEFAAILCDLAAPDDAQLVAQSLNQELQEPIDLMGRKLFVTISVGAAVYPRDATDAIELVKNADLALYKAKDSGRNTMKPFTPDMCEGKAGMMELEGELRHAVKDGQLRLHYQPKVNRDGQIVGFEALVRWQHPRLGMVPPAKFISLAEDTGLIVPIGTWVIEEAARQSRSWIAAGFGRLPISVNVSAIQFAQSDFVLIISNTLGMAGSTQPCLEIELTETLLMGNVRDAAEKLALLRTMNVSVAIDDFGTGYSSLAYLQRLSLDTLKIDHSFVSTIKADAEGTQDGKSGTIIVRAIVALAKSLGLQVVAEGVETIFQRDFLLEIGCDQLQGYLFSPPKPAAHIETLLCQQGKENISQLARCA